MSSASKTALRVALLYASLALAWGIFSRGLLPNGLIDFAHSPAHEDWIDFAFAVSTGLLLFSILRSQLLARVEAGNLRTQDALRRAYSEMELRVHARTADLQQANQLLREEIAKRDRMERDLAALLDFSQQVGATLRIETLLELVLDRLADLIGYTAAAMYECQEGTLTLIASRGRFSPNPVLEYAGDNWQAMLRGENVGQNAPVITTDQATGGSAMFLPLVLQDHLVGMVRLNHSQPGYFGERQAKLAFIIANQAAVAIENARLYEEAQRTGVLRERARLARELHDSIIQEVHGLVWKIQAARALLDRGSTGSLSAILGGAVAQAKASLSDLRLLIFELRPELLEESGLTGMLAIAIETLRAAYPARFSLELGPEPGVPLHVKEALYRIAREALQNAARHAEASEIVVRLQHDSDEVLLEVVDNGAGFDASLPHPGHLGLVNIRERALQVNGAAELISELQCGTRVVVRVPCHSRTNGHGSATLSSTAP